MKYDILPGRIEWEWDDNSFWTLDWFRDAGCFCADRWIDEDDLDGAIDDECVIAPGDLWFLESLDALEDAIGRLLPPDVREALQSWSDADPFTEDDRTDWGEMVAFGITRKTPEGEWIETFAPPGDPSPFAYRWIPEATLWEWGLR